MESRFPPLLFNLIFWGIVGIELVSEWTGHRMMHICAKPAIMLMLIAFTFLHASIKTHAARNFLIIGMIIGLGGDVLLMFKHEVSWAMQAGLGSFLVGHLFYIAAYRKGANSAWNLPLWYVVIAVLYGVCLLVVLFPYTGEMFIPLVIYAIALLGMMLVALGRRARVSVRSFRLVFGGALCFVASDSVLAFNLFVKQHPALGVILMALYAAGQYGICMGMLEQMRDANAR